jgi:Uma2 family endonuclease
VCFGFGNVGWNWRSINRSIIMAVATTPLTYAEFLKLPEAMQRCEVIDGELRYMTPVPTTVHQRISRSLFRLLDSFVVSHGLGEVFYAPLDVLIRQAPLRVRQPDLLFISQPRLGIIDRQHVEGGPDLVVEILSPGNTRVDLEEKLADYAATEVQECWLVSPEGRTVEVLRGAQGGYERTGLYGLGDTLLSTGLAALRLPVDDIW